MKPGDTLVGLDVGDHLWLVISEPVNGRVAVVNPTSHRQDRCIDSSCHVEPGEHAFVVNRWCVFYRKAYMNPIDPLQAAIDHGVFRMREPLRPELLERVQRGALVSRFTARVVQEAVRRTLERKT